MANIWFVNKSRLNHIPSQQTLAAAKSKKKEKSDFKFWTNHSFFQKINEPNDKEKTNESTMQKENALHSQPATAREKHVEAHVQVTRQAAKKQYLLHHCEENARRLHAAELYSMEHKLLEMP